MKRWSKEWVESVIQLLYDPYGDYNKMRKELKSGTFWKKRIKNKKRAV